MRYKEIADKWEPEKRGKKKDSQQKKENRITSTAKAENKENIK